MPQSTSLMQGAFDVAQGSADGRIWTIAMLHGTESLAGKEQAHPRLMPVFLVHQGDARSPVYFVAKGQSTG